ncbi:MAG: YARHG domain-containing protein [Bacteroidaceae bacterium]|nr:YARHG domain-containing protein [Bacteroidaceae bacterium]
MKRTILLSVFTALCCSLVSAAGIKSKTYWTDSDVSYTATVKGNLVLMEGGTCHEGGFRFALRANNDGSYTLVQHPEDVDGTDYTPVNAKPGDKILLRKVDKFECLVFYNANGQPTDVLKRYDGDLEKEIRQTMYTDLEGRYNHPGGELYTFASDKCAFGTEAKLKPYTFITQYDIPVNTFRTADGKLYTFLPSLQGIDLFKATVNPQDEDDIEQGACVGQLEKLISDVDNGRWPFTATEVVTTGRLGYYNKYLLRVMRNEIYARHGWHFDDPYLCEYFTNQWWYQDRNNNAGIKLSDLELLNVALIKAMEDKKQD